jgi:hypothetical protein
MLEERSSQRRHTRHSAQQGVHARQVGPPLLNDHRTQVLLHNCLDVRGGHLIQHNSLQAVLELDPEHQLGPLSLLAQPTLDLGQVGRRVELGDEASALGLVVDV